MLKEPAACCAVLAVVLGFVRPEIFFDDALPPVPHVVREPPGPPKEPTPWNSTPPLFERRGPVSEGKAVNLVDEGLTEWLGGAFSFMATVHFLDGHKWSVIFGFSLGYDWDTIEAGSIEKSCDLFFTVYKQDQSVEIYVPNFFKVGAEATVLFTVSDAGTMSVYKDGELVGEHVHGYKPNYVDRPHLMVGGHHVHKNMGFRGSIKDIKVWNQEVTWPKTKKLGKGRR